jgi:zinc and cadmium transporter
MTTFAWLAVYSAAIILVSLFGGCLPALKRVSHGRLQLYLSLSAGVMLGAAFFHVMPDAMEKAGATFGWWMALGVVGLFCIERFIAPHSHEPSVSPPGADKNEPVCDHHHGDHHHGPTAAPPVAGWMAVLGLTLHTFMNGFGLAGAVQFDADQAAQAGSALSAAGWALPGLALFLAIVLHKPADALAISTVLTRKGVGLRKLALVQFGFAAMIPVGAAAFFLTRLAIAKDLQGPAARALLDEITGAALAFSAGTFVLIALSDLLPEVQFHRHDRVPLFLALVAGVAFMGGIALLEPHEHDETKPDEAKPAARPDAPADGHAHRDPG